MAGPIVLTILDGWGLSPNWQGNAISFVKPPNFERLWRSYPHAVLQAGPPLSRGQVATVGNSELGHAMLGTGRMVTSDFAQITQAAQAHVFATNPLLTDAMKIATQLGRPVHLIGLVSNNGIHSDLHILRGLLELGREHGVSDMIIHAITDGRDSPPRSAGRYLERVGADCAREGIGRIGTIIGRYYAMDRNQNWDRTLVAYNLWTSGAATNFADVGTALTAAYNQNLTDEALPPLRIGLKDATISDGDVVIIYNTRVDRLKQLVRAFTDRSVFRKGLHRAAPLRKLGKFVSLVSPQLDNSSGLDIAFPPADVHATLGEIIAGRGLKQLRATESEKYTHVTSFFNGGREVPYPGEERLVVPSPKVRDFATRPAMATPLLVKKTIARLREGNLDVVILNLANVDLVGHTGNLLATAEAIRVVDQALGELEQTVLDLQGTLLITADHGNAEQMLDIPHEEPDRRHTPNPVPLILVSNDRERDLLRQATIAPATLLSNLVGSRATLADVAPTILNLLEIPVPVEMTGQSLLEKLS